MHRDGDAVLNIAAQNMFPGISLFPQLVRVKRLIARTQSQSVLDYGSGKGLQYQTTPVRVDGEAGEWESVGDYWDIDYVACYDPCYPPYAELPGTRFDGVISTDVLEHCPEEDLTWIVEELFGLADKFVFASIAGYPARKQLPNGENAHCTVRPLQWWEQLFGLAAKAKPELIWQIRYFRAGEAAGSLVVDQAGSESAGGSA